MPHAYKASVWSGPLPTAQLLLYATRFGDGQPQWDESAADGSHSCRVTLLRLDLPAASAAGHCTDSAGSNKVSAAALAREHAALALLHACVFGCAGGGCGRVHL